MVGLPPLVLLAAPSDHQYVMFQVHILALRTTRCRSRQVVPIVTTSPDSAGMVRAHPCVFLLCLYIARSRPLVVCTSFDVAVYRPTAYHRD
jgi:hypothetical protein